MGLELWPQFTGGSYFRPNAYTNSERLLNLYPETSGRGENNRTQMRLQTTPGLALLSDLTSLGPTVTGPIYDLITVTPVIAGSNVRTFGLVGITTGIQMFEYAATGPILLSGATMDPVTLPTQFPKLVSCGQNQLLAINGRAANGVLRTGLVYHFDTGGLDVLTGATNGWLGASDADFLDGYAVASQPDKQTFFISALQDATNYDPLDFAVENDAPDTIVGLRVIHRDLFVFGKSRILVWNDVGNAAFPFVRNNSATIEIGCISSSSICKLNDTLFWLGRDARGGLQAWKMNGYNAQRISTAAIEAVWQNSFASVASGENFSTLQCFSYQEEGHQFYVINFPIVPTSSTGFTWVFDDVEGLWHERQAMNAGGTAFAGCLQQRCHTFNPNYGHIVGSRSGARLFRQARTVGTENGAAIQRYRASPHLYQGSVRNFYRQMVLDMTPYGQTFSIQMQYSNNGGNTWSAWQNPGITDRGSGKRISWNRLGSGLDFMANVQVTGTDQFSVSAAYLDVASGAQ